MAEGTLQVTSQVAGIIPIMYPDPLPSRVEITYDFFPAPVTADAFPAALLLSESPDDGVLSDYLMVLTTQDNQNLTFVLFEDLAFGEPQSTRIPDEAGYAMNAWNTMRFVVGDGQVDAYVNGVFVASWTDPVPLTTGWWGPAIIGSSTPGETVFFDNVRVVATG